MAYWFCGFGCLVFVLLDSSVEVCAGSPVWILENHVRIRAPDCLDSWKRTASMSHPRPRKRFRRTPGRELGSENGTAYRVQTAPAITIFEEFGQPCWFELLFPVFVWIVGGFAVGVFRKLQNMIWTRTNELTAQLAVQQIKKSIFSL